MSWDFWQYRLSSLISSCGSVMATGNTLADSLIDGTGAILEFNWLRALVVIIIACLGSTRRRKRTS